MLTITPIINNYYNRTVSFKANPQEPSSVPETPKKSLYDDLYESMRKIELEIVEEEVIPPPKETPNEQKPTQVKPQELETLPSDKLGYTELHLLICDKKEKEAKEFIKKHPNFDINQRTKNGFSYIWLAIDSHYKNVLNTSAGYKLINLLAGNQTLDLSITDHLGHNDLHYLCSTYRNYAEAVQKIVDNHPKLKLNQLTKKGGSYIDMAWEKRHYGIVKIFKQLTTNKQKNFLQGLCIKP